MRADWSDKLVESNLKPNMRKKLIPPIRKNDADPGSDWLDLRQAALVELTSEADACPIEGALSHEGQRGWRAGMPGVQTIRLLLDEPQTIQRIRLVFKEEEIARTQEFVLRWLQHGTDSWKDVVRQQWNFSPPSSVDEREDYRVDLPTATALELTIKPDISGGEARASLERLQIAVGTSG
jgi:hypothetical protein